jgi:ribosomal-protein-alanine N-acetyltransferase
MIFSPMTPADLDEVMEIERRSFPEPWSRGMILHELKVPFSKTVLVRDGEEPHAILGYICRWLIGDEIQILNVAVHPERRQGGIGRALVTLVMQEAEARHVSTVTLEVRRDNTAAIQLYRTFGFTEHGVRRNYYARGEDALIMTWTRADRTAGAGADG